MRLTYLLPFLAVATSIQALSVERDTCSSIKCDDPTCDGTNNFLPDKRGQCFAGPCAGKPCLTVCGSATISCNQQDCAALFTGDTTTLMCSSGKYAGCPCQDSCPKTLPKCSDSACDGASSSKDSTGICGSPGLSDCPCTNSCPSTAPLCSDDSCGGPNNPTGADSVCISGPNRGCACKSNCDSRLFCSDSLCQGYNNADNPDKSFCTAAGQHMGCKCTSVCKSPEKAGATLGPSGRIGCTQYGCAGVNNVGGKEICTAGVLRGCNCSSQCPSTPPDCSDVNKCEGFAGICTSGDAIGCACNGPNPVEKRTPTRALDARDTNVPNANIPSSYYVASPRGGVGSSGTRSFPRDHIQRAIDAAFQLQIESRNITAGNGRQYPRRFLVRGPNAANFNIPQNNRLIDENRLLEFPIIRNDNGNFVAFARGGDQGPDRVVFDGATGMFAGLFTHRGETNNQFHRAPGHNQDVNNPALGPDAGVTILEVDPVNWYSGMMGYTGSGGGLPYKRTPTLPPANFETNTNGCPKNGGKCYCYDTITVAGYYPRDAALKAIDQTCNDWNGKHPTLTSTKKIDDWEIQMDVREILLYEKQSAAVSHDACVTALIKAMDYCQTDTGTKKIGGQYLYWISDVGGHYYIIHPGSKNPPPPQRTPDVSGDFNQ